MKYSCCDELRRLAVADREGWNGIDFLEVVDRAAPADADRQRVLHVHFVKALDRPALRRENVRIDGGERIVNIQVTKVEAGTGDAANVLSVEVDQPGDFSTYTLRLVAGPQQDGAPDGIDPQLASVVFSFKVECPSPFDCAPRTVSAPAPEPPPGIDYLAKDYASFRRVMLDRLAMLMPQWKERSPADLGVMLVEALAYTADQLSYQQDAVATEAYLGTARQRISVRRHARLMDYVMSEGCNARTWVHVNVSADVTGVDADHPAIPAGTRLTTPLRGRAAVIADDPRLYAEADVVFETIEPLASLYEDHNALRFYTWSDRRCCLPEGATQATLAGRHPHLTPGTLLLFEEVVSAETGDRADADPARRHVVRVQAVLPEKPDAAPLLDPITGEHITEITWDEEDALPFPLCISASTAAGNRDNISVARGNIVLADHGLTQPRESLGSVSKPWLSMPLPDSGDRCAPAARQKVPTRFRPRLSQRPLTHAGPRPAATSSARAAMQWSLRDVQPSISLTATMGDARIPWTVRRDLLGSDASANDYVVEIDNGGTGVLRFGDDVHGRRPEPGTSFTVRYRTGNGPAGNIGADALAHVALNVPAIRAVRNPLPASGGQDPESLEDVRQRAPVAYRVQERAVTPDDYAAVSERHADVQRAAATFRWTGSWHTAFVTVDRGGGAAVTEEFEEDMRAHLERYRMAGHDVDIDGPRFVSLELDLHVCVAADYFRSDVERELHDVLSNRNLPDGRRGAFHPDNWTFGQPVYLSAIVSAAHQVTGVESVTVRVFRRQGVPESSGLATGRLDMGRLEIVRLDNDRNFAERGRLTIALGGGK
jgi:hypothetical protein